MSNDNEPPVELPAEGEAERAAAIEEVAAEFLEVGPYGEDAQQAVTKRAAVRFLEIVRHQCGGSLTEERVTAAATMLLGNALERTVALLRAEADKLRQQVIDLGGDPEA